MSAPPTAAPTPVPTPIALTRPAVDAPVVPTAGLDPAPGPAREIELKFHVPPDRVQALQADIEARGGAVQRMQARYFDTPAGHLARAGLSLRLRQEGRRWVQTLKWTDERGAAARWEHEVALPAAAGQAPEVDPARHAGTPAGEALARCLAAAAREAGDQATNQATNNATNKAAAQAVNEGAAKGAGGDDGAEGHAERGADRGAPQGADAAATATLVERHRTEVRRWACTLTPDARTRIALSMDVGEQRAGDRHAPIREAELELQQGPPAALADACAEWIARHGLLLASRSKAAQGEQLGSGAARPVVKAGASSVRPGQSGAALLRAVVADCLAHIAPNADAVAAGSADADHLHQTRVGLRRLRTALRDLSPLHPAAGLASWEPALAATFRALGEVRDRQAVIDALAPELAEAGIPQPPWQRGDRGPDAATAVREPAFQTALATLQVYAAAPADDAAGRSQDEVDGADEPPGQAKRKGDSKGGGKGKGKRLQEGQSHPAGPRVLDADAARQQVRKRLRQLHRQVRHDGARFRDLPVEQQHRVRKRLKRMRYLAEFMQPLFDAQQVDAYLAVMRPAQDELGRHNDLAVACSLLDRQRLRDGDPAARATAKWLARQLEKTDRRSQKALRGLDDAPRFWRKRAQPA